MTMSLTRAVTWFLGQFFPCGRVGIYELDYKYDVRMRAAIKVSKVAVAGVYMAGTS